MGQRLVVTVNRQGKDLCKMYFHWSAYTIDALHETNRILECIYNGQDESEKDLQLRLIRFCEEAGGGIKNGKDSDEWKHIQSAYPNVTFKADGISRNYGLIAISEEGMADLQSWSEGDVFINLDEDEVRFGVYGWYESFEDYIDEMKSWGEDVEGIELGDIPDIKCDIGLFNVNDIGLILASIENINGWVARNGNEIYMLIA